MFDYTKYLGIPFKNRGRDLTGLDCYGLILLIYKDLGITLYDTNEDYSDDWSWKGKDYFRDRYHLEWEKTKAPKFPDIIALNNGKGIPNHAGVYIGKGKFIHCVKAGVVLSRLHEKPWKERVYGFYRYKKSEQI